MVSAFFLKKRGDESCFLLESQLIHLVKIQGPSIPGREHHYSMDKMKRMVTNHYVISSSIRKHFHVCISLKSHDNIESLGRDYSRLQTRHLKSEK